MDEAEEVVDGRGQAYKDLPRRVVVREINLPR
jgi:hypothetical protein